ncbi:hypothetical protein EV146_101467 [Mesobacillus foraminis]|uniref:Uncharacterized protein n=1 Tax=Mesobacillus foraminis TaxID=279826 RepID=A0A4R2BM46_9BACI|nr:hypothetical protein EV146_101467 [Mesobacillus foraminis]
MHDKNSTGLLSLSSFFTDVKFIEIARGDKGTGGGGFTPAETLEMKNVHGPNQLMAVLIVSPHWMTEGTIHWTTLCLSKMTLMIKLSQTNRFPDKGLNSEESMILLS